MASGVHLWCFCRGRPDGSDARGNHQDWRFPAGSMEYHPVSGLYAGAVRWKPVHPHWKDLFRFPLLSGRERPTSPTRAGIGIFASSGCSSDRSAIDAPLPVRSATPAICAARAEPELRRWLEGGVRGPRGAEDPVPERLESRLDGDYPHSPGSATPPPGRTRRRNPFHPLPARPSAPAGGAGRRCQGGRSWCGTSAGVR